jgi:hypothetical protein
LAHYDGLLRRSYSGRNPGIADTARCHDGAQLEADAAIFTVPLPLLHELALPQVAREQAAASADIGATFGGPPHHRKVESA